MVLPELAQLLIVFLFLFGLILVFRFKYYSERKSFLERFKEDWTQFFKYAHTSRTDKKAEKELGNSRSDGLTLKESLLERFTKMKSYLESAGIDGSNVTVYNNLPGYIVPIQCSPVDNFLVDRGETRTVFFDQLTQAIGFYKDRIKENFNLTFWVVTVLKLPRTILGHLGLSEKSVWSKILSPLIYVFLLFVLYLLKLITFDNLLTKIKEKIFSSI